MTELERLDGELRGLEPDFRAALVAVESEQTASVTVNDSEARELRELTGRASVGDVLLAALERRATTGAILELQTASQSGSEPDPPGHAAAPDRGAGGVDCPDERWAYRKAQTVAACVRQSGAGAYFGLDRPTVAAGDAVYPGADVSAERWEGRIH